MRCLRALAPLVMLVACNEPCCPEPDAARADAATADGDGGADASARDGGDSDGGSIDGGASVADGGEALDCTGLESWSWADETLDSGPWGEGSYDFAGGQWYYDTQYAAGQLRAVPDHPREPGAASIRAYVDPRAPVPADAPTPASFRAEIARRPWHEVVPIGTELWIGWSYYLPPTYVQDTSSRAALFQLHAGRHSPPVEIAHWVPADYSGLYGTQLHLVRRYGGWEDDLEDRGEIPISLEPDHFYDFVVHVVWDVVEGTRGLTELWVNGTRYYSQRGGNTYSAGTEDGDPELPYGGTPKLGWYKYPWRALEGVDASEAVGVTELEMFIGPVRILRRPEGEHAGDQGYACVAPRGERPR